MPQRKIKILVIDDEVEICNLIKQSLQRTGKYKVLIAKGGNMGIWIATCRWHKPDLILLDILMPGIDGFEVLRRLREEKTTTYTPIIMVTAVGDLSAKIKAEGLYCDDYIVKPVELEVLKSRIEEVLAKRGIINRPSFS